MGEGYTQFIPAEGLGVISSKDLGSLAVILQTECDNNGPIFGEVEIIQGLYGGIKVKVDAPTAEAVNNKTSILVQIINTFKA